MAKSTGVAVRLQNQSEQLCYRISNAAEGLEINKIVSFDGLPVIHSGLNSILIHTSCHSSGRGKNAF